MKTQCFRSPVPWRAILALTACQAFTIPAVFGLTGTVTGDSADAQVNMVGIVKSVSDVNTANNRIGNNSADGKQMGVVHVFRIPDAIVNDPTQVFSAATYNTRLTWINVTTRTADLYGLGYSTSPTVLPEDAYVGAADSGASLLKDNFLVPGLANYTTVSHSGASVVSYLNAQLSAARAGGASPLYVFFRTSPDTTTTWQFFQLGMAEAGGVNAPTLAYTTETVPVWRQLPLGGGGFVTGLVTDPAGTDIYCRTDVGGAFRYVPGSGPNGQWESITDDLLPVTTINRFASDILSIEAIAVDPNNPNRLYVAGGRSTPYRGVYESTDRGDTWTSITSAFAMNGNGGFRNGGERLIVDPNNSNILWFGTRENGLQRGEKSGTTWTWNPISAVPVGQVPSGDKGGVTFVACDKNTGGVTIIYAGVWDSVGATGGIYRSSDGGTNWAPVTGLAITRPVRGVVAPNGTLYVTGTGVVAKCPRGGTLASINPNPSANWDYCGVAADPNDASGETVYVAKNSSEHHGPIYRSTNGGGNWSLQTVNYNNYAAGSFGVPRGEPDGTRSITGYAFGRIASLLVTPGNSNELWCSDFFGVARTQNASQLGGSAVGSQAIWYWLQRNQDETIVETMKVPPSGAKLLVGTADVIGFRYDDLNQRPTGIYGNTFTNTSESNVTSLDFCQSNPNIVVRSNCGVTSGANYGSGVYFGSGSYSRDGGKSWLAFGEIDRKSIASGPASWETWDLTKYLSLQKAAGVNTVTLVLGSGQTANNSGGVVTFASVENATTTLRPELLLNGTLSVAPSDDATVVGAAPSTPIGENETIGVSYAYGTIANERHIYMKFSLAGVASITSAQLKLYRTAPTTTGTQFPVGVYACADTTWAEGTITWNARPKTYSAAAGSGQPSFLPSYRTAANLDLAGGRVAVSSTDASRLVWMPFGTSRVPHYSLDCGVTWTPCVGLPAGINKLASKSNPSYLMQQVTADRVNGQFYMVNLGGNAVYRSTDAITWSNVGTISGAIHNAWRAQIVASPVANDVWYCDDGIDTPTNGGLYRSTNGGQNWGSVSLSNLRGVRQVSFGKAPAGSPSQYSVFVSANYDVPGGTVSFERGIYRSDDYGATWVALPAMPTLRSTDSIAGDPLRHGAVFIGCGGRGVFHYVP